MLTLEFDRLAHRLRRGALSEVRAACEAILAGSDAGADRRASAELMLARVSMAEGRFEEAIASFSRVTGGAELESQALSGRAAALIRQGQYDEVVPLLERAAALDARNDEAWLGLGTVAARHGGSSAAWRCFKQALDINPENSEALLAGIDAASAIGVLDELGPALLAYLDAAPLDHEMRCCWAFLLLAQGNRGAAEGEARKILLLEPEHEAAREIARRAAEAPGS